MLAGFTLNLPLTPSGLLMSLHDHTIFLALLAFILQVMISSTVPSPQKLNISFPGLHLLHLYLIEQKFLHHLLTPHSPTYPYLCLLCFFLLLMWRKGSSSVPRALQVSLVVQSSSTLPCSRISFQQSPRPPCSHIYPAVLDIPI